MDDTNDSVRYILCQFQTVIESLFCVQECYVPAQLLVSEEDAEKLEELSSEEEEIITEKTTEVCHLLSSSSGTVEVVFIGKMTKRILTYNEHSLQKFDLSYVPVLI